MLITEHSCKKFPVWLSYIRPTIWQLALSLSPQLCSWMMSTMRLTWTSWKRTTSNTVRPHSRRRLVSIPSPSLSWGRYSTWGTGLSLVPAFLYLSMYLYNTYTSCVHHTPNKQLSSKNKCRECTEYFRYKTLIVSMFVIKAYGYKSISGEDVTVLCQFPLRFYCAFFFLQSTFTVLFMTLWTYLGKGGDFLCLVLTCQFKIWVALKAILISHFGFCNRLYFKLALAAQKTAFSKYYH